MQKKPARDESGAGARTSSREGHNLWTLSKPFPLWLGGNVELRILRENLGCVQIVAVEGV